LRKAAERLIGWTVAGLGGALGAVQTAVGAQARPRPLDDCETALLRRVFGGGLDLAPIRIVPGRAGLFGLSRRPFALGNRLYLKGGDPKARPDVFVHEACHVWQYQRRGFVYAGGAILAQATKGRHAYDWRAEKSAGKVWLDFNPEAQAQFVQDLFRDRDGAFFDAPAVSRFVHRGEDLTAFARAVVAQLRRLPNASSGPT
jgi:hypothetical protein